MGPTAPDPRPAAQPEGSLLDRLQRFFDERIWRPGPAEARGARGLLFAAARLGYSVLRGFLEHRLTLRAAALTYYSALSLVPFLAFAFAVLKGLGAYGSFVQETVHPYLERTFSGNAALLAAIDYIFRFVDRTNVSTLGVVGLLTLVYSSVSLIGNVETALNDIWGARSQRPLLRQMTDYVTLLVTTPLLVMVATTIATAAQSSQAVQFLRDSLQLGGVIDFLLRFTSVVVVGAALFALFEILPNAPVRPASALLGAAVSALLWQGLLILHVRFQMGVAGYSALYSVLGAVPIFLVWTYFSWVTVLVGAQVAVSHQNQHAVGEAVGARHLDQALRERLGLALTALVVCDFRSGTRCSEAGLAERLAVARASAAEVLARLVQARILARAVEGRESFYVPGRDPSTVRVSDVRDALRREPGAEGLRSLVEDHFPPGLRAELDAAEEEGRRSARNLTLQELSGRSAEGPVRADPRPSGRSLPPLAGPAAGGPP